jgi:hypothetical protein
MSKPRFSKSRRTALAGGAALVLAGAAAGAVKAQQFAAAEPADAIEDVVFIAGPDEPKKLKERHQAWLKSVATRLGTTPEKLEQAMADAHKELGFPMPLPVPPLGIAKPGVPLMGFSLRLDPGISAAATALNMTEEALRKEWPAKSLTDIARARNIDPKVVADALKAQRRADLDKAVADKNLPSEMAEKLRSHLDQEIEHLMHMSGERGPRIVHWEHSERTGTP